VAYLQRQRVLAVALETTTGKGTAETLDASDADVMVTDTTFEYSPDELPREILTANLSRFASVSGAPIATVTCSCELRGSGTATTAPSWGKLLQISGFVESVNSDNVTYTPESSDDLTDTGTIGVYIGDGSATEIMKMYGARGDVSFEFTANQIPMASFTFTGIFDSNTTGSQLSGTLEDTIPVRVYNSAVSIGSWTDPVINSVTLNMNNNVIVRPNMDSTTGLEYAIISDRDPDGTLDPERVAKATYDPYTLVTNSTQEALQFTVGSAGGNTLTFDMPKVQVIGVPDGERDSIAIWPLNVKFRRDTGDDEFVITHA
jgi:hypothetical protein